MKHVQIYARREGVIALPDLLTNELCRLHVSSQLNLDANDCWSVCHLSLPRFVLPANSAHSCKAEVNKAAEFI